MHRPHQHTTGDVGDHQPAALAKESFSMGGLSHWLVFNFGGWHPDLDCAGWFWFKEELAESGTASRDPVGGN